MSKNTTSAVPWPESFGELLRANLPVGTGDIPPDTRLDDLGLDSLGTIRIITGIEDILDAGFPDELLRLSTFRTPLTLWHVVNGLGDWP